MYWDSVDRPELINEIYRYNTPKFAGWNVKLLNNDNVFDYVDRSELPKGFNNLIVQHKADWFRLYLLKRYGGCWIDMAIIINNKDAFNDIWYESNRRKSTLTGFVKTDDYFTHTSGVKLPKLFDNWFIMSPKNSFLITSWFNEFNDAVNIGLLNYKKKCISEGVDISRIHFNDDNDVYLTQHICIQKVLQKNLKELSSVYFIPCDDSMLKLQTDCKWESSCIVDKMLNDPETKNLPYIKLPRYHRNDELKKYFT
jgi:hypothetical protein